MKKIGTFSLFHQLSLRALVASHSFIVKDHLYSENSQSDISGMSPTSPCPTICLTSPLEISQTSQIQHFQARVPYLLCKPDPSTVFHTTPSDSLSLQRSGPDTSQSPLTPHPSFNPWTNVVFCIFPESDTSHLTLCPQSPTISHLGCYHGRLPGLPAPPVTPTVYCQHRSPSGPVKTLEPVMSPLTALWWLFLSPHIKWRLWRHDCMGYSSLFPLQPHLLPSSCP